MVCVVGSGTNLINYGTITCLLEPLLPIHNFVPHLSLSLSHLPPHHITSQHISHCCQCGLPLGSDPPGVDADFADQSEAALAANST